MKIRFAQDDNEIRIFYFDFFFFPSSDIITIIGENIAIYALKPLVEVFFFSLKTLIVIIFSNFVFINDISHFQNISGESNMKF